MAESLTSLQRQVDKLTRLLNAQQCGLPDRLTVLVTGASAASPEGVKQAILTQLTPFGLTDTVEAEDAGCTITVVCLPWLSGRSPNGANDSDEDATYRSKRAALRPWNDEQTKKEEAPC